MTATIETLPVLTLTPYARNSRIHSDAQVMQIAASIKEFGFVNPVLIDKKNNIIAGHGRVMAALKMGLQEVPCLRVEHLTAAQKRAYIIADNKLALNADWDFDILAGELDELKTEGFDVSLLGFEKAELNELVGTAGTVGLTDEDDAPPLPEMPKTVLGDLYILGNHRLLCGDSTSIDVVERLMDGKKAGLMNTDPPYGIDFVKISQSKGQSKKYNDIKNDDLKDGAELQSFLEEVIRSAVPFLNNNSPYYLWHPMLTQGTFFAAAAAADILINRQIIWVKPQFVFGRGDYHWRHELCFYGWRRGYKPVFYGERNQHTVWEVGRENDKIHPTQKPVELFVRPIKNHLTRDEICYEPFSGSGSQFIAAEKTGRICYGMELSPAYCDVIVKRWEDFTGRKAELEKVC